MRGGPRVVSPAVDWHESKCISRTGSTRPNSLPPPRLREASTGCLRLTSRSLARKGASTGVVFCSGRTLPVMAACRPSSKEVAEGDRPICCAAQTVHVTVSATAHPVHLLVRSWVALGFANCTAGVKHALCQGFLRQITPRRTAETAIFANCHNGESNARMIQVGSFYRADVHI